MTPAERNENVESQSRIIKSLCHDKRGDDGGYVTFLKYFGNAAKFGGWSSNLPLPVQEPPTAYWRDILRGVDMLKSSPTSTRDEFRAQCFPTETTEKGDALIRGIVRVGFMVDCDSKNDFSATYHLSNSLNRWGQNETFANFTLSAFSEVSVFLRQSWSKSMKAWKIDKRHGISIEPTDDLAQHLLYNKSTSTIKVFRQIKWLKCQISHTQDRPLCDGFGVSLQHGSLPSQLLLETLVTIYYILLPLNKDPKSLRYAKKLIKRKGFDPELRVHSGSIRHLPDNFECRYWGRRLHTLKQLIDNPPATNRLASWIERHTSERNALTVAIIGVFLAALFGFLSCVIGIAQLVVSIIALRQ